MSVSQSNFNLQDIDDILSHLSEREKTIVILRYGLDQGRPRALEEVGEMFNVTGERIRQIEAKAIRKLHHWNPSSLNVLSQCLSNPQHVHSAKYTVRPKRATKQSVMDEKNEKMQQCKRELMKMGFSEIESEYLLYCYRTYSIKDLLKLANPKDALMKLVKEKSANVKSLGLFKVMPEDPFKIVEEIRIAMLPIHSALDYVRIREELLTSFKFTSREISSLFHLKKTDLDKIANLTIYEILLYITKNEPPHVTNAETATGKDIMLIVLRAIEEYKTNTSQTYKMRNFQACQAMQEIDKQHKTIKNIGIGMMIFSFISAFVASETGGGSFGVLALIFFAGLFIYIWHNNT